MNDWLFGQFCTDDFQGRSPRMIGDDMICLWYEPGWQALQVVDAVFFGAFGMIMIFATLWKLGQLFDILPSYRSDKPVPPTED